jgi:hypothetical protein
LRKKITSVEVGTHYVGPKWESKSGSKVEVDEFPAPDVSRTRQRFLAAAFEIRFDWTGIFGAVTFIQRVNTTGGNAPTEPGGT